jgi:hypothetical protein
MADEHSNCGGCRYFRNMQIMGVCRLYPQQQNKHESDWCGQYQAKAVKMRPVYDITTDQTTEAPQKRKYVRKANA